MKKIKFICQIDFENSSVKNFAKKLESLSQNGVDEFVVFDKDNSLKAKALKEIISLTKVKLTLEVNDFENAKQALKLGVNKVLINQSLVNEELIAFLKAENLDKQVVVLFNENEASLKQVLSEFNQKYKNKNLTFMFENLTEQNYDLLLNLTGDIENEFFVKTKLENVNSLYRLNILADKSIFVVEQNLCENLKQIKEHFAKTQKIYQNLIKKLDFTKQELIPTIVQDYKSLKVLMLAYVNKQSLAVMLFEGKTCFYSRSRKQLWTKGETSGNYQIVKQIQYDCDADTLLVFVEQQGNACHENKLSCFDNNLVFEQEGERKNILEKINDTIEERKKNPLENSYTNYLLQKGVNKIGKKIVEEAAEILIAAKNDDKQELIYEISDFVYHLVVLMNYKQVKFEDIVSELEKRTLKSENKKPNLK